MPSPPAAPPPPIDPVIERYKQGIDVALLRENLKLTVEQRVLKLIALQQLAEEARRALGQDVRGKPERRPPDPG